MNFEEALRYMEGLTRFGWKLGNERTAALCAMLGNPQNRYRIVHVAGTKGKGSTTALTAAILQASGCRVGSYFSPYVYDVNERVQVNGVPIPHEVFARIVTQIRPHVELLAKTDLGQTTEFELKTLLGFLYFAECKVDFACIEVGIGGRLDATNVVRPDVTVITNIGLDHTHILGDTHERIAWEKAGIIKCGIPCITGTDHPGAFNIIAEIARERNARLVAVRQGDANEPTGDEHSVRWDTVSGSEYSDQVAPVSVAAKEQVYRNMPVVMAGLYQRGNAACAVAAAEAALSAAGTTLTPGAARRGLGETALPGRFTEVRIPGGPLVVLDGAHNAMAATAVAGPTAAARARYGIERLILVIGMLTGHEPEGVLAALLPGADQVFVCQPGWKRALPAMELAAAVSAWSGKEPTVIPTVRQAVRAAVAAASARDMVLVTGSFYTVGEAPIEWLISMGCAAGSHAHQ